MLAFDADTKILNFNEKMETTSGKCRTDMVT